MTSIPVGYVLVASGITGAKADHFEGLARKITPLRFVSLGSEAGFRGNLDAYVDIWVHPDDLETAKEVLRRLSGP